MTLLSNRYQRLSSAYIDLADQFQQLDVEHMALRTKLVPLIKALRAYKILVGELKQENQQLKLTQTELTDANHELSLKQAALLQRVDMLSDRLEHLQGLEALLTPEMEALLGEAEQQMGLVEETIQERAAEPDPDLTDAEKELIQSYATADPVAAEFELLTIVTPDSYAA